MIQAQHAFDRNQNFLLRNERVPKRILIADSDRVHCLILRLLLEDEGFHVTTCRRTLTAVSLIKKKPFDFVISENSLIGINGVQVLDTAKQLNWNTPVLLTAALCEMETYIEAMHRGALDYICKPNYGEIQRIVRANC